MRRCILIALTGLSLSACGYAEDYCHGPTMDALEMARCYAAIDCAGDDGRFYGREFDACMEAYNDN